MARRHVQDDVLGNKFSLMNAKSSKLLSSWMGSEPEPAAPSASLSDNAKDEDADLKQADFGHDRLGVGSAIPKDVADGSFTRRAPTSNDKLLEQLIGKKRAKAHLAAKQEAERASARQQPTWQQKKEEKKIEESEDEEEGRAAMITSKRQKTQQQQQKKKKNKPIVAVPKEEEDEVMGGLDGELKEDAVAVTQDEQQESKKEESDDDVDLKPKKRVKKSRTKPTSYLDELLAERSKKKKGKGTGGEDI
ncbi:uncharacterized protein EKO05_0005023 [Ascochyta rabiei]|uniref:Uncharacterized protein n=1 Tax=Didymella rabiei TaxID=5454 RepID=A0A163KJ27_DIDRA|nr:uncharacterized protein EKO05_0005023 [Ascochyta rabiei]KZM27037.1 hypothetical protein ST47_g1788 [Ascochyta rabiei]UPX14545.1 hypothetical protein EKO05_0005023 [Ascochyta rabiei]